MNIDDKVLSDVHTNDATLRSYPNDSTTGYETRFKFRVSLSEQPGLDTALASLNASDSESSDQELPRKDSISSDEWDEYIVIRHAMATTLTRVGLQVWQGALLLADWTLNNQAFLKNKCILEVGSGSGFNAILGAMFAQRVYATDMDDEILSLCQYNINENRDRLNLPSDCISVKKLDWFNYQNLSGDKSQFTFLESEIDSLKNLDLIIASDVVYQTAATKALISLIESFLNGGWNSNEKFEVPSYPKSVIISLEKRMVFSVDNMSVCCPEYDYFTQCLNERLAKSNPHILVEQLNLDLLEHFVLPHNYRSENLVIWKISNVSSA